MVVRGWKYLCIECVNLEFQVSLKLTIDNKKDPLPQMTLYYFLIMCIQAKQTLMKLLNPQKKRHFGAWLMNLPTKKRTLSNALIFYLLLIRIFSKLKSLCLLFPRKDIKFSLKKSTQKVSLNDSKNNKKDSKFSAPKVEFLEKEYPKTESKPQKQQIETKSALKRPHKPRSSKPKRESFSVPKQVNWKQFSENFRVPSVFIESWDFLDDAIESVIFDPRFMDFIVEFSSKYFHQKNKDNQMRRTIKAFMRIFLVMNREISRDTNILEFLSDLVGYHQEMLAKGSFKYKI